MKLHPVTNAAAAISYITLVALSMRSIESIRHDTPDTFVDGMGFLSLFVLSAAVMTFLFFFEPVRLLIEKKPREAVIFFLTTLAVFGLTTIVLLVLVGAQ